MRRVPRSDARTGAWSVGELSAMWAGLQPADLVLVVEVVSASSEHEDWVTKRDEYAAVAIPLYLVVDPHRGQVALFSRPEDGRCAESQVGTALDVPLPGATVRVDLADLLAVPAAGADPEASDGAR